MHKIKLTVPSVAMVVGALELWTALPLTQDTIWGANLEDLEVHRANPLGDQDLTWMSMRVLNATKIFYLKDGDNGRE